MEETPEEPGFTSGGGSLGGAEGDPGPSAGLPVPLGHCGAVPEAPLEPSHPEWRLRRRLRRSPALRSRGGLLPRLASPDGPSPPPSLSVPADSVLVWKEDLKQGWPLDTTHSKTSTCRAWRDRQLPGQPSCSRTTPGPSAGGWLWSPGSAFTP